MIDEIFNFESVFASPATPRDGVVPFHGQLASLLGQDGCQFQVEQLNVCSLSWESDSILREFNLFRNLAELVDWNCLCATHFVDSHKQRFAPWKTDECGDVRCLRHLLFNFWFLGLLIGIENGGVFDCQSE